jgi:hypothetical protein
MATNRDLLKEAIADAKSVKETAIANAKAALEEAFTPYLKEKLSAKLQEMEEEETKMEGMYEDEAEEMKEEKESMDEISLDELLAELEDDKMDESIFEAKEEEEEEESEEFEDDEEESEEEMPIGDMTPEEFEKFMRPEIEKVIQAMIDSGELEAGHEGMENEEGAEEEEEIEEDININEFLDEDLDEEVSLEELLAELEEGDVYEDDVYEEGVKNEMQEELEEAYEAIKTLKSELNEINLLNAKLLYTNKIFRNKSLTESQKVKVLTAFDKATSKKEAQLVYETLLENLKTPVKKSPIQESLGSASKALGTAKSKPIIENDAFSRMRELAFGNNK